MANSPKQQRQGLNPGRVRASHSSELLGLSNTSLYSKTFLWEQSSGKQFSPPSRLGFLLPRANSLCTGNTLLYSENVNSLMSLLWDF